jgi:hypothetical protein
MFGQNDLKQQYDETLIGSCLDSCNFLLKEKGLFPPVDFLLLGQPFSRIHGFILFIFRFRT